MQSRVVFLLFSLAIQLYIKVYCVLFCVNCMGLFFSV